MLNDVLNQTRNGFNCVGVLSEKSLKKEDIIIKAGPKDDKKEVSTECIKGKISISIPGGVMTFPIYATKIGYNGKDNFAWNVVNAMFENWQADFNSEKGDVVSVRGNLDFNDRFDERSGKVRSQIQYRILGGTNKVPEDAEQGMTIQTDGFIHTVVPELNEEDEETGRVIVRAWCSKFDGTIYPIEFFAVGDGAALVLEGDDDVDPLVPGNTRLNLTFAMEITHTNPPVEKKVKKSFGVRQEGPKVGTGDRVKYEWYLCDMDYHDVEKPEEDEENTELGKAWMNPEAVKKAMVERKNMLEQLEKDGPSQAKNNGTTNKIAAARAAATKVKTNNADGWGVEELDDIF